MKIVSGGQAGVDRAALDVALERGMECGGWCPAGRWAEDGPIPDHYPLVETPSADPAERTEWNVRDSDGTLLLTALAYSPGTELTFEIARRMGRPVMVWAVKWRADVGQEFFRRWVREHGIRTLNVAGVRESEWPGVYDWAGEVLRHLLDTLADIPT